MALGERAEIGWWHFQRGSEGPITFGFVTRANEQYPKYITLPDGTARDGSVSFTASPLLAPPVQITSSNIVGRIA